MQIACIGGAGRLIDVGAMSVRYTRGNVAATLQLGDVRGIGYFRCKVLVTSVYKVCVLPLRMFRSLIRIVSSTASNIARSRLSNIRSSVLAGSTGGNRRGGYPGGDGAALSAVEQLYSAEI